MKPVKFSSNSQVRLSDLITELVVSRSKAIFGMEGTKEPDTNTVKILGIKVYEDSKRNMS